LVLSAALIEPAALVVAAEIDIAGVLPPVDEIGVVPVTEVTPPPPPPPPPDPFAAAVILPCASTVISALV